MATINEISKSELFDLTWKLVDTYFKGDKGYQLVKHLIDSYNDFVLTKIDNIIEGFNPIEIHHQFLPDHQKFKYVIQVEIRNPTLSKPTIHEKDGSTKIMTPQDARNRNFTYAAPLYIEIHITTQMFDEEKNDYDTEVKKINNVCLGKIPVMVGSRYCVLTTTNVEQDECRYGYGGYFIINGNEKAVICQDRIAENITYVFINNKVSTYSHVAEIRSVTENKFSVPKTTSLKLSAKANQFGRFIRSNIHHVKQDVPVFILFRALGIESDSQIVEYCVPRNDPHYDVISVELVGSIEEANNVLFTRDAREYLCRYMNVNGHPKELMYNKQYRMNVLTSVLEKEFLPHVGSDLGRKAMYLGYMVNKLLKCFLGIIPFDDRDSYINKRIDTPGILLANLFRQYYGKVVKDMKNMIQKDINSGSWKATNKFSNVITKVNITKIVKSTIIESGLKFGLATGNWGIKSAKTKQGVAQVLNRLSYNATISHLRRINTPIDKTGKLVQPRKLHATQWGIICPTETPEGVSVGLVKNLSISATITIASNSCNLRDRLADPTEFDSVQLFNGQNINIFQNGTKIIINGDIIGICTQPKDVYEKIKSLKRAGVINAHSSVFWNIPNNELWICTEAGRCVRPLYIINDGNKLSLTKDIANKVLHNKLSWNDLVLSGIIEYVDVQESNNSMIAMKMQDLEKGFKGTSYPVKYTHLEMDPTLILGVLAGSIPFCDHNQAPRNAYQSLKPDTLVLMGDGSRKMIKDIQVGDEVVTFHPETKYHTTSKVINQYVKPTTNPIVEITTESGRTITATDNHHFMTNQGWIEVKDFDQDTLVGISIQPKFVSPTTTQYDVLNIDMFKTIMTTYFDEVVIDSHIKTLQELDLLPLSSTSKALPTLARLVGFAMTSRSMLKIKNPIGVVFMRCCFDTMEDTKMFEDDIIHLGFPDADIYGTHDYRVKHSSSIGNLLMALGVDPVHHYVPDWIMHGSKLVQREFLAAFQGGDGHCIRYDSNHTCKCRETVQQVHTINNQTLPIFMEQICTLFNNLGVDVTMVKDAFKHKINTLNMDDDTMTTSTSILNVSGYKISDNPENLTRYFDIIGYRYNNYLNLTSALTIEHIKVRMLGELSDFKEWSSKVMVKHNSIFVPIKSIYEVPNCLISDITVENFENQSFIAGDDFMVHNSAMCKQAIGVYTSSYKKRFDTLGHVLHYPQKPLVYTRAANLINHDQLPSGMNVIVAIAAYTGYNQEDSVIMNKSAVDRGMFVSTYYRTYKDQNSKNHSTGEEEYYTKPDVENTKNIKPFNYEKIMEDGFVPENEFVESGDVIIGKCMPQRNGNKIINKDSSVALKNNENGFIDKNSYNDNIFTNVNGDGYAFSKVRLRSERIPQIGDKCACYTGDHDVLTTKGWIPIADVTKEHKVASLVNGELVYQNPSAIQKYDFDGKLYQVRSNHVSLCVTDNHRMYVGTRDKTNFKIMEAKDVYRKRLCYKKNVDVWNPVYDQDMPKELIVENGKIVKFKFPGYTENNKTYDDFVVNMDDWITFYGIWVAEGYVAKNNNGVRFAANKPRVKEALDKVCVNMHLDISKIMDKQTDDGAHSWRCYNRPMMKYMESYSVGALNKSLDKWVWYLNQEQCRKLIHGMCLGDGHVMKDTKNGVWRYTTSSTQLADDFQRLCLHAGYSTNKCLKQEKGSSHMGPNGPITLNAHAWQLTVIQTQNEPLVNKYLVQKTQEGALDEWIDYKGTVHCCTVPNGEGVVYVRREGLSVWSGNSRSAQKGTIGMLYRQEDMPFTASGLVPDIILNPHAIPSRMTIAQLMECIMGKACAAAGTYGDATPFTDLTTEDISQVLDKAGMERYGNEIMYNSRTGEMMNTEIFIGPTYYQRLKHMVADKMHSRNSNGPVILLTRQPAEGRARDGGLRLGEMEVECNWAHGAMHFLKERFMEASDNYRVFVCKKCSMMANVNPDAKIYECKPCKNNTCFAQVRIPYASKLLFQEMGTMCLGVKFVV